MNRTRPVIKAQVLNVLNAPAPSAHIVSADEMAVHHFRQPTMHTIMAEPCSASQCNHLRKNCFMMCFTLILSPPSSTLQALGVLAFELLAHVRDPNSSAAPSPGVEPCSPRRIVSAWGPISGSGGDLMNTAGSGRVPEAGWLLEDTLPWERHSDTAEDARRQLGQLRGVVMSCVHRDSAQRPSARKVLAAFENASREVLRSAAARKER